MHASNRADPIVANTLKKDGVVLLLTDTIYGLVGSAHSPKAIARIRKLKNRKHKQAIIVLCASLEQVKEFSGIEDEYLQLATKYWPGKVTLIFQPNRKHPLIQGDPDELSFRIPDDDELATLIEQTGPLIAPSANPRSLEPAMNISEARAYFGDGVDLYVDSGTVQNAKASKVIKIRPDGSEEVFRP